MLPISRRALLFFGLLATYFTPGCTSDRYEMSVELPADREFEFLVMGERPQIRVDNAGPGDVLLVFDSPDDTQDDRSRLVFGTTIQTLPGPVRLRCLQLDGRGAALKVSAQPCTGMSLDQFPAPDESPAR